MANITEGLFPQFAGLLTQQPQYVPAASTPLGAVSGMITGQTNRLLGSIGQAFGQKTPQQQLQSIVQSVQQEADLGTPAGLATLADKLNEVPEFSGIALSMRQQAAQQAQQGQVKQSEITRNLAQADKAMRADGIKFSNPADQELYNNFLQQSSGNAGEAAKKYFEYKSGLRQREAKAGVPESGAVKVTDVAAAARLIGEFTDKPKEKLSTVADVRTQLNLVKQGNGAALPQLQRQLIKLVGDSQIAQGEVRAALGSAGIVGDTINAVNQFMVGTPTADKIASVEKVINALEEINADAYNRGRNRASVVIGEANLSPETKKALIPPAYETGAEKAKKPKKGSFVEGKIYVDAKGNRARYVNGQWQPVQ